MDEAAPVLSVTGTSADGGVPAASATLQSDATKQDLGDDDDDDADLGIGFVLASCIGPRAHFVIGNHRVLGHMDLCGHNHDLKASCEALHKVIVSLTVAYTCINQCHINSCVQAIQHICNVQQAHQQPIACNADNAEASNSRADDTGANRDASAVQSGDDSDPEKLDVAEDDDGTGQAASPEGSRQPAVLSITTAPDGSVLF